MSAQVAVDVLDHWSDAPSGAHVTIDAQGALTAWRDHPGCTFCDALSGRQAYRAAAHRETGWQEVVTP